MVPAEHTGTSCADSIPNQPISQQSYLGGILLDNSLEGRFVASVEFLNQPFIIDALGHGYHIRATGRGNITGQMWKILQIGPTICADWASFWRKLAGRVAFLRQIWYYVRCGKKGMFESDRLRR